MDERGLGPDSWSGWTGRGRGLSNVCGGGFELVVFCFELHVLLLHLVEAGREGGDSGGYLADLVNDWTGGGRVGGVGRFLCHFLPLSLEGGGEGGEGLLETFKSRAGKAFLHLSGEAVEFGFEVDDLRTKFDNKVSSFFVFLIHLGDHLTLIKDKAKLVGAVGHDVSFPAGGNLLGLRQCVERLCNLWDHL